MKDILLKTGILVMCILSMAGNAIANDGFSGHTPEGLVFSKTEGISMEKEVLKVSLDRVEVQYVFRNVTDKDISATIAFPIPEIVCDSFTNPNYPSDLTATVNGKQVDLRSETKAVLAGDYGDWWWQKTGLTKGQDVTDLLLKNNVPLDCRQVPEFSNSFEQLRSGKLSPVYAKLVKLGLACCDPLTDPPSVDYTTRVKYYWQQTFPAGQLVRISHSYTPSFGAMNGFYESMTDLKKLIDRYKPFFESHFSEESKAGQFSHNKPFRYVNYILKTANTWHGPIKDFTLMVPTTGNLIVTTMDGPLELINGDLVIHKKNFRPEDDLTVFYFGE